ncbi:MAG: hypothetical protein ACRDYU_07430 [Actinomycetes bacterium]
MPSRVDLTGDDALYEGNDETLHLDLASTEVGFDFDTATEIEVLIKTSADQADGDGVTLSMTGNAVSVTDGPNGLVDVEIPGSALVVTQKWWHVRVTAAGKRKTAMYGTLEVVNL